MLDLNRTGLDQLVQNSWMDFQNVDQNLVQLYFDDSVIPNLEAEVIDTVLIRGQKFWKCHSGQFRILRNFKFSALNSLVE